MDLKSYRRWYDYSRARDAMLAATDTAWAPWFVANNEDKKRGRLNIISHLLSRIPYEPLELPEVELPEAAAPRRLRRAEPAAALRAGEVLSRYPRRSRPRRTTRARDRAVVRAVTRRGRRSGSASTRDQGLPGATATERLQTDGPNALPAEKTVPGWRRFLEQYAAYMQIILLIAGVLSLAIGEWSTGAVLLLLTVVNAVVGLRQEGKAESAMNALKSLTKQTARVRATASSRRYRSRRSSSATSCSSPPATTSRPTAGSSRRAR